MVDPFTDYDNWYGSPEEKEREEAPMKEEGVIIVQWIVNKPHDSFEAAAQIEELMEKGYSLEATGTGSAEFHLGLSGTIWPDPPNKSSAAGPGTADDSIICAIAWVMMVSYKSLRMSLKSDEVRIGD